VTDQVTDLLSPPRSWQHPASHYEVAMQDPWYRALFALTDVFHGSTVEFWRARGVRAAYLPVTTGSVSSPMGLGSDSKPVPVRIEGVDTYLADSMQFLLEYGCRLWEGGCYYVMPSFRGELADDTHLCQFFHSEAEIVGDLDDVIATVEDYVRHLARAFLEEAGDLVGRIAGSTAHVERVADGDVFHRITFRQAVERLDGDPRYVKEDLPGVRSLTRAGEHRLMDELGDFLWVTGNDHLSVPFYQAFEDADRTTARNGDLLFGIGETVGCGQRHTTADQVRSALDLHQVDEAEYRWYLRMREIEPLLTSGFGMGVERFMLWLLDHDDIRDIPLLLRFNGQRIDP
jgi:asparaginyl-tRNA synthetase